MVQEDKALLFIIPWHCNFYQVSTVTMVTPWQQSPLVPQKTDNTPINMQMDGTKVKDRLNQYTLTVRTGVTSYYHILQSYRPNLA